MLPNTASDRPGFYRFAQDNALNADFHLGQMQAWDSTTCFVCVRSETQGKSLVIPLFDPLAHLDR
jgi:hypothetical protein